MMGVQVIDPNTHDANARELLNIVYGLARRAQLPKMPEVGIYQSPEVNAFATGPTRSNSLVAVSTGLLNRMDRDQLEGVLGHEITHIANGDMVTMVLIQGVINAIVMILARIVASAIAGERRDARWALVFVLQIVFSFLGMMVVTAFSRYREFRADAGGGKYASREKMISALKALQGTTAAVDSTARALATLKISGGARSTFMSLLATHPPLDERIRRLETARA
jgi:heat shock protein HtpX